MAGREQLILLDNFEQLTEDETVLAFMAQMMQTVTTVQFLVTSRRRLPLQQGRVVVLGGLPYPNVVTTEARSQAAVSLFWERAERVAPAEALVEGEMPAILPHSSPAFSPASASSPFSSSA